jgi:uncharacterized protein YjbI with pentapeptide repeats
MTSAAAWATVALGCARPELSVGDDEGESIGTQSSALVGPNLAGTNLGGINLAGTNLAGTNLGGPNLGGTNLAGTNLAGTNLAGTNLGGNNLAGTNLAGTNLAGTNLAGTNLAGTNLAGTNLAGTNLAGSNLAGTNLGGNSIVGTNLNESTLAGTTSGQNIHGLAGPPSGMLYSAEDAFLPKTAQCIVLGLGSTAFAKLLGQQHANAKMHAAIGRLPWGFATTSGGPLVLSAWEAVIWGDTTYCTFVVVAPPQTAWSGVAGFVKSVFRWNAPTTQSLDLSGIDTSAPYDPTLNTAITNYAGMMNAAQAWQSGTLDAIAFVAGELAFASAATNNQSVTVDFASWARDKNKNALVLGNVDAKTPPTYAESVYIALDNGDGTVGILLDDAAALAPTMPAGMTDCVADLEVAYQSWIDDKGPKPIPRRCGGALFLEAEYGEPVPLGKCDNGLSWGSGRCVTGSKPWSSVTGINTGPNTYMQLTQAGGLYRRSGSTSCVDAKPVLGETYVHMWGDAYDYNRAFGGTVSSTGTPRNATTENATKAFDNQMTAVNGTDWCVTTAVTPSAPLSLAYTFGVGSFYAIDSYTVTSAGDAGARDPRDWTLQGCNGSCAVSSDAGWTKLDTRTGQTFGSRWQTNTYSFANTFNYVQVRLQITANNGDAMTEMAELQLFDSNPCLPETDAALCASYGKNCGSITTVDNCGATRTVANCGTCTSPQICAGGGIANVCGSGAIGVCYAPYVQANCFGYQPGTQVSRNGHNWTCSSGNCMNCAANTSCAPGSSGCPWGVVWQDNGLCH